MIKKDVNQAASVDIYSAAIILFVLKTGGWLPYKEHKMIKGYDFYKMIREGSPFFWEAYRDILNVKSVDEVFDRDFRALFDSMTRVNASDRATIKEIKKSSWYNGPTYTDDEIIAIMD